MRHGRNDSGKATYISTFMWPESPNDLHNEATFRGIPRLMPYLYLGEQWYLWAYRLLFEPSMSFFTQPFTAQQRVRYVTGSTYLFPIEAIIRSGNEWHSMWDGVLSHAATLTEMLEQHQQQGMAHAVATSPPAPPAAPPPSSSQLMPISQFVISPAARPVSHQYDR